MYDHEKISAVRSLVFDYVRSPSLRHLRDPHSVNGLVKRIIETIGNVSPVWTKWEGEREALLRNAAGTWIPVEDLRGFLNQLPGPRLTLTDVEQRLRAVYEEPYSQYPNERLKEGTLALYRREVAEGTEMAAIIGALQEYTDNEADRLRREDEEAYRARQKEEREALEQRFLSGADCKWTPVSGSKAIYTRINGRAYRLSPTKDMRLDLHRIVELQDAGKLVGTYRSRGDASKALLKMAYEPEPRW